VPKEMSGISYLKLHARDEDIARYEKLYSRGWGKVRERCLARQNELGLVLSDLKLTPRSGLPANRFNTQTGWADRCLVRDGPSEYKAPTGRKG
jgi:hypothetical protein